MQWNKGKSGTKTPPSCSGYPTSRVEKPDSAVLRTQLYLPQLEGYLPQSALYLMRRYSFPIFNIQEKCNRAFLFCGLLSCNGFKHEISHLSSVTKADKKMLLLILVPINYILKWIFSVMK